MSDETFTRAEDVSKSAMKDGLLSGFLMGIPSSLAVWVGMRNPNFVKSTNWQSRTAMVIMPPLFMFALASEHKVNHRIKEMVNERDHSREVGKWASERQNIKEQHTLEIQKRHVAADANQIGSTLKKAFTDLPSSTTNATTDEQLHALYRKSVEESGVRIVPGNSLGIHHQIANFWQENPFKILVGLGVPTVLYIFKGKSEQKHLQLQSQIMHTRVYGQFAVLTMLLTLMGFKSYMDSFGKFITEEEANYRVTEMEQMRRDLLDRIAFDRKLEERRKQMLKESLKDDTINKKLKKVKKVKKDNMTGTC